jgi:VanZ family protein
MQAHMAMGRTGDIIDFAANTLGAIVGIVSGHKFFARLGTI